MTPQEENTLLRGRLEIERDVATKLVKERDKWFDATQTCRAAILTTQCPRPANNRPDDFTVQQCAVECRECGCDLGAALTASA